MFHRYHYLDLLHQCSNHEMTIMKIKFSIPCPQSLQDLHNLLPNSGPIPLSSVEYDQHLGIKFTVTPQHCFSNEMSIRNIFIANFWENASPHINRDTTCIVRQYGRQTVLQLNTY